jgi:hypothetical protein
MSKQFTCNICSYQFKSRSSLTWHLTSNHESNVQASSLLFKCPYFSTTFHHKKGFVWHLNSQNQGKTESSINSESSPNNNNDDGQINSQFDFCGDADGSACAGPVSNNNKPHAKVSFHKKLKYSDQETASSNASYTSQDVDNEDKFENSNLQKHLNINSYSKDDFRQALLDSQHHVEDQEIPDEKLNNKQAQQIRFSMKTLRLQH